MELNIISSKTFHVLANKHTIQKVTFTNEPHLVKKSIIYELPTIAKAQQTYLQHAPKLHQFNSCYIKPQQHVLSLLYFINVSVSVQY